jgi:predicted GIY-YIG superfamily endonuclease
MNDCITIHTLVYVLELEGDNWYIGKTHNLNVRLAQHWSGDGAKWTRLYKPLRLHRVSMTETEQQVTNEYILLYGKDNVRGGNWTKV